MFKLILDIIIHYNNIKIIDNKKNKLKIFTIIPNIL